MGGNPRARFRLDTSFLEVERSSAGEWTSRASSLTPQAHVPPLRDSYGQEDGNETEILPMETGVNVMCQEWGSSSQHIYPWGQAVGRPA